MEGIAADVALDLAAALGTSAKLKTKLQATYQLDQASTVSHVA